MKSNRWPDFLFTVAVRFICGAVLGVLGSVVAAYRRILRAFSHDNLAAPIFWLAVCGVAGGVIAVFTIPCWQTPWYKGIRDRKDRDD